MHYWSDSDVYEYLGAPNEVPLVRTDGLDPAPSGPRHVVETPRLGELDLRLLSGDVCIVGFGSAFSVDRPPSRIIATNRAFVAPELCFGVPASPASDLWSFGCLVFELCSAADLFPLIIGQLDLLVGSIVDTLGPIPPEWRQHYVDQASRARQQNFWYDASFTPSRTIEWRIEQRCWRVPGHLWPDLLQLLSAVVALDPSSRLPAAELAALLVLPLGRSRPGTISAAFFHSGR